MQSILKGLEGSNTEIAVLLKNGKEFYGRVLTVSDGIVMMRTTSGLPVLTTVRFNVTEVSAVSTPG